ncbi:MAG: GDP-mannose 4,6-dehydratase [Emcibacteraceae bacterium]|nr:GDP-mannose 4,6-dehydratase [Emcibacteraceae bacterium]
MKRFFITGITGQVGSQLADYLLEHTDYEIHGFLRWQEAFDNLHHVADRINKKDRIFLHYGDLCDYPSLVRALETARPDFISHLAEQSYPKTSFDAPIETLQTNIIGTANLLEVVRKMKENDSVFDPSIHVCSSSEVYGKANASFMLNEDTQFHGASPYSISKIGTDYLGRFYAEAYGLKTVITRMGTHSGPRRSDVFFESTVAKQIALIEAGLQEPAIFLGNLDSKRTFQDARDAVRAYFLLCTEVAKGNILPGSYFNIAGDEAFKLDEVVEILLNLSSIKDIKVITDISRIRPIDADYQMFDNTKIKAAINWEPEISVFDMFQDLLNHWRDQIALGRIPLNR